MQPDPHRQPDWLVARRACLGKIAPAAHRKAVSKPHKPRKCPESRPLAANATKLLKKWAAGSVREGLAEFFNGLLNQLASTNSGAIQTLYRVKHGLLEISCDIN